MAIKTCTALTLTFLLTLSFSLPSYALYANKPYPKEAQEEAQAHTSAIPDGSFVDYVYGRYELNDYEISVSESYVENFLEEAKKTPMLSGFNLSRYKKLNATVAFFPSRQMWGLDGHMYQGRVAVNYRTEHETLDPFKTVIAHEMIHVGSYDLGMTWLCEVFAVLAEHRVSEAMGREPMQFDSISPGRNDLRIAQFVSGAIGGEEAFAKMAATRDPYDKVKKAFDKANNYISFDDFSFAQNAIRSLNDDVMYAQNLEYLAYMEANPDPANNDETAAAIKGFYTLPARPYATQLAKALTKLSGGYETAAYCLDALMRAAQNEGGSGIFFDGKMEKQEICAQIGAVKYAKEKLTVVGGGEGEISTGDFAPWAGAVMAYNLTNFIAENEIPVSASIAMENADALAMAGKLLAVVFGEKNLQGINENPELTAKALSNMEKVYEKRTGLKLSGRPALAEGATPQDVMADIVNACFTNALNKEKAAEELSGFTDGNKELLESLRMMPVTAA